MLHGWHTPLRSTFFLYKPPFFGRYPPRFDSQICRFVNIQLNIQC